MKKKPKKALWPLRRGERIPERFIKAEPRLAGMEHNAMFRLIIHYRHSQGILLEVIGMLTLIVVWLGVIVFPGSLRGFAFNAIIFGNLALSIWQRRRAGTGLTMLGIPEDRLRDLARTGCDGKIAAAGVWGSLANSRYIKARQLEMAVIFALVVAPIWVAPSWALRVDPLMRTGSAFAAIFVSYKMGFALAAPAERFLMLGVRIVRRVRQRAEAGLGYVLSAMALMLPVALIMWAVIPNASFLATLSSPAMLAALCAAGLVAGVMRGRDVRRRRDEYFERLAEHMTWILHHVAAEDDRVVPGA